RIAQRLLGTGQLVDALPARTQLLDAAQDGASGALARHRTVDVDAATVLAELHAELRGVDLLAQSSFDVLEVIGIRHVGSSFWESGSRDRSRASPNAARAKGLSAHSRSTRSTSICSRRLRITASTGAMSQ